MEEVRQNHPNVTPPAQANAYGVCYQIEMLSIAAEIARRFMCLMECISLRFLCPYYINMVI